MLPRPRVLRPRRLAAPLALAGALGALALFPAGAARAQAPLVTLTPTVTSSGSLFTYTYSVTNFSAFDLAVVNLNGLPMTGGALSNFSAPTGFQIGPYDPGVGILSFSEDTDPATAQTFGAGSTVSGFSFSSTFAPAAATFDTLDVMGNATSGTTLAPNAGLPVPEASTWVSLGAGLLLLSALALPAARRRAVRPRSH